MESNHYIILDKYYRFLEPETHQMIVGQDGIGKTTFALFQAYNIYHNDHNIKVLYVDADDKSSKQRNIFRDFMKEINGTYINLYESMNENITNMESLLKSIGEKLKPEKEYYIIVDNLLSLIGEFENDNSRTTIVAQRLRLNLLGKENVRATFIAHAGKDVDKGARGASSFRAMIGQSIILKHVDDIGIVAKIDKNSINNSTHKTFVVDKSNNGRYDLTLTKIEEDKIVEDKISYRTYKLKIAVESVLYYAISNMSKNFTIRLVDLKAAIHQQAHSDEHTDSKNYLSHTFISSGIQPVIEANGITLSRNKDNEIILNMDDIDETTVKNLETKTLETLKPIVIEFLSRSEADQEQNGRNIYEIKDLEDDILTILSEPRSADELRKLVYGKESKPEKYSKAFALTSFTKAINNLVESENIKKERDGRKTTFSIAKQD